MPSGSKFSFGSTAEFITNNFGAIFLAVLFFVGGFFAGSLWTENQMMRSGKTAPQVAQEVPAQGEDEAQQDKQETLANMPELTDQDHIQGAKNPKIFLVEYSDYECPFCQRFHPTMNQVMEEYGDQVAWVFRHYPLSFHPNAQPAAEAAECIASVGGNEAFWSFTDAIFDEQQKLGGKLSPEAIDSAIQTSGVSKNEIQGCIDNGDMADVVSAQMTGGAKAGISGTPGTILVTSEGEYELISGALPYAQVSQLIEKYL